MISILKDQTLNQKLPKYLPAGTGIAHKSGELDEYSHDTGIVYAPWGEYIIVALSKSADPQIASETIAQISKDVYDYFKAQ